MARRSKVRIDRVIILILVALLVGGALGFGIYKVINFFSTSNNTANATSTFKQSEPVATTHSTEASILNYDIYDDGSDDLDFNFIIAEIQFKANDSVSFDFSKLQTSEKIVLNDISKYTSILEQKGYILSDVNLTGSIISTENTASCKLLIPYQTDSDKLIVYNSEVNTNTLEFDLTKDHKQAISLKLEDNTKTVEVEGCDVVVSSSYISSSMLHNGVDYPLGSSQKVFTFRIQTTQASSGVKIVNAQYLRDGTSTPIDAMSSDYCSEKDDNALGQELVLGDNGALFFMVVTNEVQPTYDGVLLLTFSNSEKVFEIPTTLQ